MIEIADIIRIGVDIVILVVFPVTGFLAAKVLSDIHNNLKEMTNSLTRLWDEHSKLSKEFYLLSGEHIARHGPVIRLHM